MINFRRRQLLTIMKEDINVFVQSKENFSILSAIENHFVVLKLMLQNCSNENKPNAQSILRFISFHINLCVKLWSFILFRKFNTQAHLMDVLSASIFMTSVPTGSYLTSLDSVWKAATEFLTLFLLDNPTNQFTLMKFIPLLVCGIKNSFVGCSYILQVSWSVWLFHNAANVTVIFRLLLLF